MKLQNLIPELIRKLSIRTLLGLSFAFLFLLSAGFVGFIVYWNTERTLNNLATEVQKQASARIRRHLDSYLDIPVLVNQLNLSANKSGEFSFQNFNRVEARFRDQLQQFETLVALTYADSNGNYIGLNRNVLGVQLALALQSNSTGRLWNIYDVSNGGRRLLSSRTDYDARKRDWYKTAIRSRDASWTKVFVWETGDVGIDLVSPVYDAEGKLQGVFDSSLRITDLGRFLHSIELSKNGHVFILDRQGKLVACSQNLKPYVRKNKEVIRIIGAASKDEVVRTASREILQQFETFQEIEDRFPFEFEAEGERQYAMLSPISDPPGIDWLLVTVIPEKDFMGPIRKSNREAMGFIVLFLVGFLYFGGRLVLWFTKPISELSSSAKAIAKGDLSKRVYIQRTDELGEMAQSFNDMADRLENSFLALKSSEEKYRRLFEDSPIPLWEEDMSEVKKSLDEISHQKEDWEDHLNHHPELVLHLAKKVRYTNLNRAGVISFGFEDKYHALQLSLYDLFQSQTTELFQQELLALLNGQTLYQTEYELESYNGKNVHLKVLVRILPGSEESWEKVLVAIQDITEERVREKDLADALVAKDSLLKELNHRTKNNMQLICALLDLQSSYVKDQELHTILSKTVGRIQSMALVHQKIYQGNDLSKVDLKEYIEELCERIIQRHSIARDRIKLDLDLDSAVVLIDSAIPCGLVLNELLSNAFLHAFPEKRKGTVSVRLKKIASGCIQFCIKDDGIGVNPGFDVRKDGWLGLQNAIVIVEGQLKGSIEFDIEEGFCVTIEFQDNHYLPRV